MFRYSKVVALIDGTNKAIDSNITTIQLAQKFTPTLNSSTNYTLEFNNALYNPHSGHNSSSGGIVSSTGFNVGSDGNEYFFDDDDGNCDMAQDKGIKHIYQTLSNFVEEVYTDKVKTDLNWFF